MKGFLLAVTVFAACEQPPPAHDVASTAEAPKPGFAKAPPNHQTTSKANAKATVTLTSVTFADNCGGTAPWRAPKPAKRVTAKPSQAPATPADSAPDAPGAVARRRCEQTSMQLSITGASDTTVQIKSVEVFDERGKSLGVLASSNPSRWSEASATYEPWAGKVAAGETAQVSYVLEQPSFVSHYASPDRTYTVKVIASVGGVAQPLQTTVMIVAQPAPVPT